MKRRKVCRLCWERLPKGKRQYCGPACFLEARRACRKRWDRKHRKQRRDWHRQHPRKEQKAAHFRANRTLYLAAMKRRYNRIVEAATTANASHVRPPGDSAERNT